jgi:hypothetical protein
MTMAFQPKSVVQLANGQIKMWVEQGQSICLRAATGEGDPVELTVEEVRELIGQLAALASQTDD